MNRFYKTVSSQLRLDLHVLVLFTFCCSYKTSRIYSYLTGHKMADYGGYTVIPNTSVRQGGILHLQFMMMGCDAGK